MEVPKTVKGRIQRMNDLKNNKTSDKLDFARNLGFWKKYLSQKKAETRPEVPSTRELAEHRGHRKSASNNFSIGNPLAVKPAKTAHIRSITSYNAMIETRPKNKKREQDIETIKVDPDSRNYLASTGKMHNHVPQHSNIAKPQSLLKMFNGQKNKETKAVKKVILSGNTDHIKKTKKVSNAEQKKPRLMSDNFKSFGETRKPAMSLGADRLKSSFKEFKQPLKNEVVINNNINIQPVNSYKENNFSGNIKISIDFYDSKTSNKEGSKYAQKKKNLKELNQANLYEKKTSLSNRAGFFSKKNSIMQLDDLRLSKEPDTLSKVKSNCVSPTYQYYHRRMASETGLQAKKLVFNLNIDMRKQGTNQSNKPARKKSNLVSKFDSKKKFELFNKNTISTKRNNKLIAGHRRNVLSLPGTSLSSFLTNLRIPVQLENQKNVSMTPDLSANKERQSSKKKSITKLRVSTSRSKKLIVSYSRISEEENEDEHYDENEFQDHYSKSKGIALRSSVSAEAYGSFNKK